MKGRITVDELRHCVTGAYAMGCPDVAEAFERAAQALEELEREIADLQFDLDAARSDVGR